MFQTIASYIWGAEEDIDEQKVDSPPLDDQIEIDNEWIYIPKKDSNGKIRSPLKNQSQATESAAEDEPGKQPEQNSTENNRVEDMSVEELLNDEEREKQERGEERILEVIKQEPQKTVGRRHMLLNRQPLKDLNEKLAVARKNNSRNNIKRDNMTHHRNYTSRANKKYGRMEGKHVGMVGKRSGK